MRRVTHAEAKTVCGIHTNPSTSKGWPSRIRTPNPTRKPSGAGVFAGMIRKLRRTARRWRTISSRDQAHLYSCRACTGSWLIVAGRDLRRGREVGSRISGGLSYDGAAVPARHRHIGLLGWRRVIGQRTSPEGARVDQEGAGTGLRSCRLDWPRCRHLVRRQRGDERQGAGSPPGARGRTDSPWRLRPVSPNCRLSRASTAPTITSASTVPQSCSASSTRRSPSRRRRRRKRRPRRRGRGATCNSRSLEPWRGCGGGAGLLNAIASIFSKYWRFPSTRAPRSLSGCCTVHDRGVLRHRPSWRLRPP